MSYTSAQPIWDVAPKVRPKWALDDVVDLFERYNPLKCLQ